MLRVSVAEVQRTILKQFGINVGALVNSGNFTTAILSRQRAAADTRPASARCRLPASAAAGALNLFNCCSHRRRLPTRGPRRRLRQLGRRHRHGSRAIRPSTARCAPSSATACCSTLAEPNLTAVSGEPAKFLAGGEYPIPVVDSLGQVSVVYKEFGIGLAFTPVVLSEGRISLKIETEVSELTNEGAVVLSGIQIPALKKRQAKSTVELPSGGSLAIAGLLSEDTRQNIDGFPGLKDLPILGTLFRSRDYQQAGNRARRDRHALHGAPDGAPGAGAPARRPRRPDRSQGELPRPHQSHLRRRPAGSGRRPEGRLRIHRGIGGWAGDVS